MKADDYKKSAVVTADGSSTAAAPAAIKEKPAPAKDIVGQFNDALKDAAAESHKPDDQGSTDAAAATPQGETKDPAAAATAVTETSPATQGAAATESTTQATTDAAATAATEAKPKPEDQQAAAAAVAAAAFNALDEVEIAPGFKLTKAQALKQLQDGNAAAQAANAFIDLFKMSPDEAKARWSPVLNKLREDDGFRHNLDAFANLYEEPGFAEYFVKAAQTWIQAKEQNPNFAVAAQQAKAVVEPVQAQVAALTQWQKNLEAQQAKSYFDNEVSTLRQKYPELQNPQMLKNLCEATNGRYVNGRGPTITQVADEMIPALRAMYPQRPTQQTQAKPAVPALNGGAGASPVVQTTNIDSVFDEIANAADPVGAWLKKFPNGVPPAYAGSAN